MVLGGRETASILRRGIFAVNKTKDYTSADLLNHLKRLIVSGRYLLLFPIFSLNVIHVLSIVKNADM